ncbi:hypothetical protein D3C85_1719600 [compost metagenome]
MDLAHQFTHGGVHLLVALDAVEPGKLLADDHRLVVGFLATAVHVALVKHVEVLGVERFQGGQDTVALGHRLTPLTAAFSCPGGPVRWSCR